MTRKHPIRRLKVGPAFEDLYTMELRDTPKGLTLLIHDVEQGGVEFWFPSDATAEQFGDRLTETFARRFAPKWTPALIDRVVALFRPAETR